MQPPSADALRRSIGERRRMPVNTAPTPCHNGWLTGGSSSNVRAGPWEANHLRFAVGSADWADKTARKEAPRGSSPLPPRPDSLRDSTAAADGTTRPPQFGSVRFQKRRG